MKDAMLYRFARPMVKVFTHAFLRPKYEGVANIPKDGAFVFAGNHTHIMDSLLLMSFSKRSIHFLAKDELWKFPKSIIFSNMGLIPVNRRKKDPNAMNKAKEYLESGEIIGIFPEGTISRTKELLPFKFGAVKIASDTNVKIVPFAISGDYKLFSKNLKIKFGKPLSIKNDLKTENKKLKDTIYKMIKEN